jgi:hypothetical protein
MFIFACPVKFGFLFNRGSISRKAKILTTGIHVVFRGLKFFHPKGICCTAPDEEIEQKGTFGNGLADTDKHRRLRERKEFERADIHIPAPALSGSGSRGRDHAPPLSQ